MQTLQYCSEDYITYVKYLHQQLVRLFLFGDLEQGIIFLHMSTSKNGQHSEPTFQATVGIQKAFVYLQVILSTLISIHLFLTYHWERNDIQLLLIRNLTLYSQLYKKWLLLLILYRICQLFQNMLSTIILMKPNKNIRLICHHTCFFGTRQSMNNK